MSDSIFELNPRGGGQRRALQIVRLAERAGFALNRVDHRYRPEYTARFWHGARFVLRTGDFHHCCRPHVVRECGLGWQIYRRALREHVGAPVLLWEYTRDLGLLAPYVAHEFGFKVLALPHNFESLVPDQRDQLYGAPLKLRDELRHLRCADAVFTISREEQWLLNNRDIKADCLPYYPPEELLPELVEIRQRRLATEKRGVLLVGSVSNPPVRAGMLEVLHLLRKATAQLDCPVHVGGNDSEKLATMADLSGMIFHGPLSTEKLNDLLSSCRAVIAFQRRGAGALTKIPEALLAGVPVLANGHAARSAWQYDGIHAFENAEELTELLRADLPLPPAPPQPVREEARFMTCLRRLVNEAESARVGS